MLSVTQRRRQSCRSQNVVYRHPGKEESTAAVSVARSRHDMRPSLIAIFTLLFTLAHRHSGVLARSANGTPLCHYCRQCQLLDAMRYRDRTLWTISLFR